MLAQLRPALVLTLLFTLLLGIAYPLAVTSVSQLALPFHAGGSILQRNGKPIGSARLGQNFTAPRYLHPRPSAAGPAGYDASASSGSNLGPLNPDLAKRVARDTASLRSEAPGPVPADAVTTSASGLDPDISPANAARQATRIAMARGLPAAQVLAIIARHTDRPWLGFLGQPRVNVLNTNLALDAAKPAAQSSSP